MGCYRAISRRTAMLRVWSDFLTSADARKVTLLGLLDLSVAFDCVDHDILLQRLEVVFDLTDTAVDWIRLFVSGRTQRVSYHSRLSSPQSVLFAVPQGSVLGPLLSVRALHRGIGASRRSPRPASAHVRRRLPSLPQHIRRRRTTGSR